MEPEVGLGNGTYSKEKNASMNCFSIMTGGIRL